MGPSSISSSDYAIGIFNFSLYNIKDEHYAMVYIISQKKLEDVIFQACTLKSETIFKIKSKTAKNTALF